MLRDQARSFRHGGRLGPVELDTDRTLFLGEIGAVVHRSDPAAQALGREELRNYDVGAERAAETPERRFGYPRHGGEDERHAMPHGIRKLHGKANLTGAGETGNRSLTRSTTLRYVSPTQTTEFKTEL